MERPLVIAIDGPAAAGKGTLGRRLAAHLGLAYLDTGQIYRAAAARLLERGEDPADAEKAAAAAEALTAADLDRPNLRDEAVGEAASRIAAIPAVRAALLEMQRRLARHPPSGAPGIVMDGRDIGTVVCPDAQVKLFVTASPEERARRRHKELLDQGMASIYANVLADVIARDERDSQRAIAPLRPAHGAFVLDTTKLDADAAFDVALAHVRMVLGADRVNGRVP